MKIHRLKKGALALGFVAALFLLCVRAQAEIVGETGTTFNFAAQQGTIQTGDGDSILVWGYKLVSNPNTQYPGPTLILDEDTPVTMTLVNNLPTQAGNVSMVFPGHVVTATGGVSGLLTHEAPPDGVTTVTYQFTPTEPGTYMYHSGSRADLQVPMGLVGAIIVRPNGFNPLAPTAYGDGAGDSAYDREFLYLLTEIDPRINRRVELGQWDRVDTSDWFSTMWFVNGRNFPDVMAEPNVPWLPTQPYNCQPYMEPGERVLVRLIGAGRELHPMHYHGNTFTVIAENGRLLSTNPALGANLAWKASTIKARSASTADFIWTWTGRELGWDYFGHLLGDPMQPVEIQAQTTTFGALNPAGTAVVLVDPTGFPTAYRKFRAIIFGAAFATPDLDPNAEVVKLRIAAGFNNTFEVERELESTTAQDWPSGSKIALTNHGAPFPVIIPPRDNLSFGQFYSGSPFMGEGGGLPPSHPALNDMGGYFYMWHSHTEKELTNNDIWPGGYVTFMIIYPPGMAP